MWVQEACHRRRVGGQANDWRAAFTEFVRGEALAAGESAHTCFLASGDGNGPYRSSISRPTSRAGALCVIHPAEMRSTPVAAVAAAVSGRTRPEGVYSLSKSRLLL